MHSARCRNDDEINVRITGNVFNRAHGFSPGRSRLTSSVLEVMTFDLIIIKDVQKRRMKDFPGQTISQYANLYRFQ